MTEQDKQALIKHFCKRDCGDAAENCEIMPCHEIELIQEFPTTEADSDTISRAKAIEALMNALNDVGVLDAEDINTVFRMLPPEQPERIRGRWIDKSGGIEGAWNYCSVCGEQAIDLYDFCPNCGAKMEVTT